jgi:hypothetical protein
MVTPKPFLDMIVNLREQEEVLLYSNILSIREYESKAVLEFLKFEYKREALELPSDVPDFAPEAALWAAKILFISAQLLLYRQNQPKELSSLLPDYPGRIGAAEHLSADLCLRFLPDLLEQLKVIEPTDPLIDLLERILSVWHYSGIRQDAAAADDYSVILENTTLKKLYVDRILQYKNESLARRPEFYSLVKAALGIHAGQYWPGFELNIHE